MTNLNNSSLIGYTPSSNDARNDILSRNTTKIVKADVLETVKKNGAQNTVEKTEPNKPATNELQQALDVINRAMTLEQRSLSFSVDDISGRSIIKVTDVQTEQLIRQIPSEEVIKVAQDIKRLQEEMGQSLGLLVDRKV